MRIRSTSSATPSTWSHASNYWGNTQNPVVTTVSGNYNSSSDDKYMEDVVTPNYRKWAAEGRIINSPMFKRQIFEKYVGGLVDFGFVQYNTGTPTTYCGDTSVGYWMGALYGVSNRYKPAGSIDVEALNARAVTDAWAKASANETEIYATIAEAEKTVVSLRAIFYRAVKIFMALKKFDLKRLAGEITPKELASRYMEARYAIRPLIYDVKNTLNALQSDEKAKRFTARGGCSDSCTVQDEYLLNSNTNRDIYVNRTTVKSVTARAGVLSQIDTLTKFNVWGLDRPFTSAWELVPMSFVADWFFNLGKIIASWQPTTGMKALASWVVVETTIHETCSVSRCVAKWPTTRIHIRKAELSAMCYRTTVQKERIPSPSLPVMPRFNINLDVAKLLDLGIIIRNFIG